MTSEDGMTNSPVIAYHGVPIVWSRDTVRQQAFTEVLELIESERIGENFRYCTADILTSKVKEMMEL